MEKIVMQSYLTFQCTSNSWSYLWCFHSQVTPSLKFFHFMLACGIAFVDMLCFLFAKWDLSINQACLIGGWPCISPWPWIGTKNRECCTYAHINTPHVKEKQCIKGIWQRVQNIVFSKTCRYPIGELWTGWTCLEGCQSIDKLLVFIIKKMKKSL